MFGASHGSVLFQVQEARSLRTDSELYVISAWALICDQFGGMVWSWLKP